MANQTVNLAGTLPEILRSSITQELLASYMIPWVDFRVWDAMQTNLPGTAANDDLALIGGTWATASPMIQSSNPTGGTVTQYARFQFEFPPEYDAGQRVYVRCRAKVAVACQVSNTLDVVAYEGDKEGGIGADLCTTAAQTLTTSFANYDFVLTPTNLTAGDILDARLHVALDDTGGAHAGIVSIGKVAIVCDIRG